MKFSLQSEGLKSGDYGWGMYIWSMRHTEVVSHEPNSITFTDEQGNILTIQFDIDTGREIKKILTKQLKTFEEE